MRKLAIGLLFCASALAHDVMVFHIPANLMGIPTLPWMGCVEVFVKPDSGSLVRVTVQTKDGELTSTAEINYYGWAVATFPVSDIIGQPKIEVVKD